MVLTILDWCMVYCVFIFITYVERVLRECYVPLVTRRSVVSACQSKSVCVCVCVCVE